MILLGISLVQPIPCTMAIHTRFFLLGLPFPFCLMAQYGESTVHSIGYVYPDSTMAHRTEKIAVTSSLKQLAGQTFSLITTVSVGHT